MRLRTVIAITALMLSACATATTSYGPATMKNGLGYRETQIESNRYRVVFRGGPDLKPDGVEDYALRRAAELTIQNGGAWFHVVNRSTEFVGGAAPGGSSISMGGSTGSYGSGVGVGIGLDLSGDTRKYETTLEIVTGTGMKPDDPSVYNAAEILARPIGGGMSAP